MRQGGEIEFVWERFSRDRWDADCALLRPRRRRERSGRTGLRDRGRGLSRAISAWRCGLPAARLFARLHHVVLGRISVSVATSAEAAEGGARTRSAPLRLPNRVSRWNGARPRPLPTSRRGPARTESARRRRVESPTRGTRSLASVASSPVGQERRGSKASRRASPTRLNARTVTRIAIPGNVAIQGESMM